MRIKQQVALAPYTTFKVGGPADYFCIASSIEHLHEACLFAEQRRLPLFVFSGGSNLLVSDDGFHGLAVKVALRGKIWKSVAGECTEVTVAAGETWDTFVEETVLRGLRGLENLSGIPGSVGGTPVQNVGAYGAEVADTITEVSVFDTEKKATARFSNKKCAFGYRHSFFKTPRGKKYVVLTVTFLLSKKGLPNLSYKDLQAYFAGRGVPSVRDIRRAVLAIRSRKFPDLACFGTAGSFFKNPVVSARIAARLREKFPALPSFSVGENKEKIPGAWLIEHVGGWKGTREGGVGSFEQQALVLVNYGGASARDIFFLSEKIIEDIFAKTRVRLEREVQLVGSFV